MGLNLLIRGSEHESGELPVLELFETAQWKTIHVRTLFSVHAIIATHLQKLSALHTRSMPSCRMLHLKTFSTITIIRSLLSPVES